MDKNELAAVLDWVRSTDLVEVSFKNEGKGFSFSKTPQAASAVCGFPGRDLVAVSSPGVGIFQWSEPGAARAAHEAAAVAKGAVLGLVQGAGKPRKVEAPCAGILRNVCVEAGQTVQFGQPLFFIDRKD